MTDATRAESEVNRLTTSAESMVDALMQPLREENSALRAERDAARAQVAAMRDVALKLANAADAVGVRFFDGDDPDPEVEAMQAATLEARSALDSPSSGDEALAERDAARAQLSEMQDKCMGCVTPAEYLAGTAELEAQVAAMRAALDRHSSQVWPSAIYQEIAEEVYDDIRAALDGPGEPT